MGISVEISMYPLKADYKPLILDFIARLRSHETIMVITNEMSTRIFGDFDTVMPLLTQEMKTTFQQPDTVVMVMKIIGKNLSL
ncbi:MAG: hypothetical protein HC892_02075 [Saprospiraceae bacterium]|nr:hypothetical protein [Saprospiraceae bacterium]